MDEVHQLAGAALGSLIITQLYWLSGFLKMSMTGLSAQIKHTGHEQKLQTLLIGSIIAIFIAVIFVIFKGYIFDLGMHFANAQAEVEGSAKDYFSVRILGAPFALLNIIFIGFLIGQQKTKAVLLLQLVVNITNIAASLVFVYVFELGIVGVALATILAEFLMCVVAAYALKSIVFARHQSVVKALSHCITTIKRHHFTALYRLNLALFVRNILLQGTLAFVSFKGAQYGEVAIAVNTIILQFFTLIALGLDGIANALESLVGEQKGLRNHDSIKLWVKIGIIWSSLVALLYALVFAIFDLQITALLTHHVHIINEISRYSLIICLLPIIAHWCFLFDGIFVGLSKAKAMQNTMFISTFLGFAPAFLLFESLQNTGVWLAMLAFLAMRGLSQFCFYLKWSRQSRFFT